MKSIFNYEFRNPDLLEEALTTPSFRMTSPLAHDNPRLEFLGDAVLGLLAAEKLYAAYPGESEGRLTVKRTHMVSTVVLCEAALRHNLLAHLRRNVGAAELPRNSKTLADAVEAVVGAVYLDGGLEAARQVFDVLGLSDGAGADDWAGNPKGALQVRSQALTPPRLPVYILKSVEGKAHSPVFNVRVEVEGLGAAEASASSRKEAEALAASRLLESLT